ncbi:MAG TPA: helix-turn-helix domain-containing protein [Actinophytocola sp.]|nr:helix-turn-helix domain-containing protein [Actinophytocola sp.]
MEQYIADANRRRQFSELLRSYRLRRGTTQRQLADLSTVSVRAIRDLEQGRTGRPRRDTVQLIADGLGLSGRARIDFGLAAAAGEAVGTTDLTDSYDVEPAPPPAPLDSLVGRDVEVEVVKDLLVSGSQRLVTVVGLCGVGKTRLAMEVAGGLHESGGFSVLWRSADDEHGHHRPALSVVGRSEPLRALVRSGLDILCGRGDGGTAEFASVIGQRPTLLVLDGYPGDQLRTDRVVALLQECRALRVLITARAPFEFGGERVFPLAPLEVPSGPFENVARLRDAPSVRLLVRHVRRVQPGFEVTELNAPAVAELCRELDGMPAALEAAAMWFMVYGPAALLDRLRADQLDFATERTPELADDLRRRMSWLSPAEQSLLDTMAAAGPDWAMAEAVELTGLPASACADLVRRLLLLGLVRPVDGTERTRFQVLRLLRALDDAAPEQKIQTEVV